MKIPNNIDYDRYQWENAIDRWIFDEEHRAMLKRNLLDGIHFFDVRFMQARKTNKNATYILICLTNLIKGDKIVLPLMNVARFFISFFPCQINHSLQGGFFVVKNI